MQGIEVEANYAPKNWAGNQQTMLFGVRYQLVPMRGSFHVSLGATYLHMSNSAKDSAYVIMANGQPISTTDVTWRSSLDQIDAEVFIGNEWKVDNFFFGCDWVGTGFRLWKIDSSLTRSSNSSSGPTTDSTDYFSTHIDMKN